MLNKCVATKIKKLKQHFSILNKTILIYNWLMYRFVYLQIINVALMEALDWFCLLANIKSEKATLFLFSIAPALLLSTHKTDMPLQKTQNRAFKSNLAKYKIKSTIGGTVNVETRVSLMPQNWTKSANKSPHSHLTTASHLSLHMLLGEIPDQIIKENI